MESRERWEALQISLREARAACAEGDSLRALEAVDAALAIDPDYLAAQSLRDRLLASLQSPSVEFPQTPSPVPAPESASQPIVSESYGRFEDRVRRRRVERRLDAARQAIAKSRFAQASAAIEELRELDPALPELAALTGAVAAGRTARPGGGARWAGAAAAAFAGVLLTAVSLQPDATPPPRTATTSSEPRTLAAVDLLPTAAVAAPVSPAPAASPSPAPSEGVRPAPAQERRAAPDLTAVREVRAAAPAPRVEPESRQAISLTRLPRSPVSLPQPVATLNPANPAPPAPAAAPPVIVAARDVSATAPAAAIRIVDDQQLVQEALQRYRSAYEELDAASAQAVWPAVDQAALARAFDGLASQALTFQNCDVQVAGNGATAACSGTTRYVPKVGSREPRTEPRRWSFALRKRGADWQIENARAER